MKKKLPLAPAPARAEEATSLAATSVLQPRLPLAELEGAIGDGLLAFSCATGLLVIAELMEEERTRVCGPKNKHDGDREAVRNNSAPGSGALGGRRVPVSRPRIVRVDGGGEVGLESYEVFSSSDLLTQDRRDRARQLLVVLALAITTDGTKVPVGPWQGDTENTTVVTDLLPVCE